MSDEIIWTSVNILNSKYLDIWEPTISDVTSLNTKSYKIESKYHQRPDALSHKLYGNAKLWWVFAMVNQDKLNDVQKKGLKYYEDLQKSIPRSEIDKFKDLFETEFNKLKYPEATFEIVGSYRRGVKSSGDIDIIITDKNNDKTVFSGFIKALLEKNIVTELLSNGKTKSMAIGKLPGNDNFFRRIDFLYAPPTEYAFAILYFTGSKAFNTTMRAYALKMSLSLNEHGLYKMNGKTKGDIIEEQFNEVFPKNTFCHFQMHFSHEGMFNVHGKLSHWKNQETQEIIDLNDILFGQKGLKNVKQNGTP